MARPSEAGFAPAVTTDDFVRLRDKRTMLDICDRSWIEPLVEATAAPALRLAVLLTDDRATAEDIVQEAFFRAWQSARTPREMPGFRRWLYHIVVNLARARARRNAILRRLRLVPQATLDPATIAERTMTRATIGEALRQLSRREREAVYLRFFEDAPYEEVAVLIGSSEGACRVLIHRALKKIGARLSAEGLAPEGAHT